MLLPNQTIATLVVLCSLAACKHTGTNSSAKSSVTYYSASNFACDGNATFPSSGLVLGTTEQNPMLLQAGKAFVCTDHWRPLDINNPPWAAGHFFSNKSSSEIERLISTLPQSYRRTGNGGWEFNEPDCTAPMRSASSCGVQVELKVNSYTTSVGGKPQTPPPGAGQATAFVYDACPERHWNNTIKDLDGNPDKNFGGNPCRMGADHLDLKDSLWSALGLPTGLASADVAWRLPDGSLSGSTHAGAASGNTVTIGGIIYHYCESTTDTSGGQGFGFDANHPDYPCGGSCRLPGAPLVSNDTVTIDGTVYHYCVTSGDTSGGQGYGFESNHPEYPQGGSCKIRPAASTYQCNNSDTVNVDGVTYHYCLTSLDTSGGNGFGFEANHPEYPGGGSCKIRGNSGAVNGCAATAITINGTTYPYCTTSSDTSGGNGYGFEPGHPEYPNGGSCKIASAATTTACASPVPDTVVIGNTTYHYCTTSTDTSGGNGYGWDVNHPEYPNGGSCKLRGTSGVPTACSATSVTINGTVYPYCATSVDTSGGNGYGWESNHPEYPNGGSCKIRSGNSLCSTAASAPSPAGTVVIDGVTYHYCPTNTDTSGGHGYGWDPSHPEYPNGGSCKIRSNH